LELAAQGRRALILQWRPGGRGGRNLILYEE